MKIYSSAFIIIILLISFACQTNEKNVANATPPSSDSTLISTDNNQTNNELEEPKQNDDSQKIKISDIDVNKASFTKEKKNKPLIVAEQMPQFPGGDIALHQFIAKNLKIPNSYKESGLQGRVTIRFVVRKDGKITDVTILRGIEPEYDNAVKQMIEKMPNWIPGKQNGKTVDVYYTVPILVHPAN